MIVYIRGDLSGEWFVWGPAAIKLLGGNFCLSESHWFVPGTFEP